MDINYQSRILITCPKRIPPYLREELTALGYPIVEEVPAGIVTQGTFTDAMRLNLHIRTGHRVLLQLRKFFVRSPDDLFKSLSTIPWEDIIPADGYFSVVSSVETAAINNSMFANVKCKDAIVDRIRNKCGRRPDSGADTSKAVVFLYWKGRDCFVYLDTSGEPLSKRGYRTMPWQAPMRETLAAATIMASRWDAASTFVNPMCGSGTLAIEAALLALNRPPSLARTNFAFMHLLTFDRQAWQRLQHEAQQQQNATTTLPTTALPFSIIATDRSAEAIAAARHNAQQAGVAEYITFEQCDFSETAFERIGNFPVVMLNPPYGERIGGGSMDADGDVGSDTSEDADEDTDKEELETTYKRIGDFFKQHCAGTTGYVFTGNLDAAKRIGLKAKRRFEFYNSDIDCRLLEYELYEGSKRGEQMQ